MSWFRSALKQAAEAGQKSGLGRNLQKYAGTVYQTAGSAVAGGTRLLQDRLSGKTYNNFRHAVRRLEDVALTARGEDRQHALLRWLGALKDLQRASAKKRDSADEAGKGPAKEEPEEPPKDGAAEEPTEPTSTHKANLVLFFDEDISREPLTFRDVFLRSLALENLVVSFIEEAPEEEEVTMFLEMMGLCLAGGPELHNAIISGIQDLSKAAATYVDEVKTTREGLLQLARSCITGLKLSAEAERLDTDVGRISKQMEKLRAALPKEGAHGLATVTAGTRGTGQGGLGDTPQEPTLKEGAARTAELLRLSARLQECYAKKAALADRGLVKAEHESKVVQMKESTSFLQKAIADMKKKVEDNKQQKADALSYRQQKAKEVAEAEKILGLEVMTLEEKRKKLEAELKEVREAIRVATHRHILIQEEKEQFDEASSNLVAELARSEQELNLAQQSFRVEAGVLATWQSFLEDTWVLQTGCQEQRERDTQAALKESRAQYLGAAATHLVYRQEEVSVLLKRLSACASELESAAAKKRHMADLGMEGIVADLEGSSRKFEEKYLEVEGHTKRLFSLVERVKLEMEAQIATAKEANECADECKALEDVSSAIAGLKAQFDSLVRPKIEPRAPTAPTTRPAATGPVGDAGQEGTVASQAITGAKEPGDGGGASSKKGAQAQPKSRDKGVAKKGTGQVDEKQPASKSQSGEKEKGGADKDVEDDMEGWADELEQEVGDIGDDAGGDGDDGWDFDKLEEETKK